MRRLVPSTCRNSLAVAGPFSRRCFFTNWVAYRGLRLPTHRKPWFLVRRGFGVALQALGRVRTALQLRDAGAGDDFTMQVPETIGEVTLRKLGEVCLGENQRRLARYDRRLLRPQLVPRLVGLALRLTPGRVPWRD